jgi:hypothetical protein
VSVSVLFRRSSLPFVINARSLPKALRPAWEGTPAIRGEATDPGREWPREANLFAHEVTSIRAILRE